MIDFRPVGFVIGWLVAALGAAMMLPLAAELVSGTGEAGTFLSSAAVTFLVGGAMVLSCNQVPRPKLTIQQIFLLTTGAWVVLPIFGALPFILGAPGASITDAYFEAVSAFTTTGSTVFSGLDQMPRGTLLWRGLMQWLGGVGIVVVAMAFLPALRVGGMQIFRSEAFDTMGKLLPRAGEIASRISIIYVVLTVACALGYSLTGMGGFDALVHSMTTLATGGMANVDASFGAFKGGPEYVASFFMVLASLPFVRYMQLVAGTAQPLLRDSQVHAFFGVLGAVIAALVVWQLVILDRPTEEAFREALFNAASIMTGTGYASIDYQLWGAFPMALIFVVGLVGGCSGSTCCSIKIFRYQLLFATIRTQIRRINNPHGMFSPRYQGRVVDDDTMNSVMAFFYLFFVSLAVFSVILTLMGLDPVTAISGAATALANIGPGLGPIIGPAGNFAPLSDQVKWVLVVAMLIGRLELMAFFVIFTLSFWRR
ncbi:TrkH family potassium uptake protein [Halovulum dunhuangense]|uniref:Trk system potassium uptake protein n=1 Tax=Halovulum dunhuangense TaxID=1505036 RepID=A0A849L1U6_9RHOB|nr:TrkH family potassium uptake protein [Halovulum dunhuangense]NNU80235.1 TrkH family potassium uptake protein [Halovulum dunhuangense]